MPFNKPTKAASKRFARFDTGKHQEAENVTTTPQPIVFSLEQIEARRIRREAAKREHAEYLAMKKAKEEQDKYESNRTNHSLALAMALHPRLGADSPLSHEVFVDLIRSLALDNLPLPYEDTEDERAELIRSGRDAIERDRRGY